MVFEPDEWQGQAAWLAARKPMPLSLNDATRLIASFDGFLGRKGDGEPGAKSLWQGLQRVMDFAIGMRVARQAETRV